MRWTRTRLGKILNKSIFNRLMAAYLVIILVTLATLGLAFSRFLSDYFFNNREKRLLNQGQEIVTLARDYLEGGPRVLSQQILQEWDTFLQARIWIVDQSGLIVASSENRRVGRKGVRLDPEEVGAVLRGEPVRQRGVTRRFGLPMISVGLPVWDNGKVIGAVIMNAPVAAVRSSIRQVEILVLYAALVTVPLAVLLALFISGGITQPLRKMGKTALEMAKGNYRQKIEVAAGGEIGQLGEALNILAASLDETISVLHRQEEIRREFVANVSHELRTPLTSIRGFVEPLIDGTVQDSATRDRYLRIIREEAERLTRLISELLDLARMEAGGVQMDLHPLEVSRVLEAVVDEVQPAASRKGVTLEYMVSPGLPKVLGDQDRLRQAVLNLVDNAIRFTPPGGRVTVAAGPEGQAEAGRVMVSVTDTGTGIAGSDLPFIWDRFYKADKSRTPSDEGTGLGLSIVKLIVEGHGGQVGVESHPGKGSCFHFTIPQA